MKTKILVILMLLSNITFSQITKVTPSQMSTNTKNAFRTALGVDTMVSNVNTDDFVKTLGVIKLADKPYNVNYSGLGRTKLRKNMVGGVNTLTSAMVSTGNTIYEIHYDFDLAGATITLPANTYLDFKGGRLSNGSFGSTYDYYVMGDWKNGTKNLTSVNYMFPLDNDEELLLDVSDLPGPLAKYNLVGDNTTDNSTNFIAIFSDSWFIRIAKKRQINIVFTTSNRAGSTPSTYVFKQPMLITTPIETTSLKMTLYAHLRFDLSAYSFRTIQQITDGVAQQNLSTMRFVNLSYLEIEGRVKTNSTQLTNRAIIDGGLTSVGGTFYEGVTINSVPYANTENLTVLSIAYCKSVVLRGIHVKNGIMGCSVSGSNIDIQDCEFSDIPGENGLTLNNSQNSTLLPVMRFATVRNCYFHDCQDLGIMVGGINITVENCYAERCGNNNPSLGANYGVGNSFNSGGGYSVEMLSVADTIQREDPNIMFVNCVARNCYNYGFYTDAGGVKYIGCTVKGIKPTYLSSMPTNYLYSSKALRVGAAFNTGTTYYTSGEIRYPIKVDNCLIDSVAFTFKNGYTTTVGGAVFTNTKFKRVLGHSDSSTDYATTLQGATFYSCEFDATYEMEKNHIYYDCIDVNKNKLLSDGFVDKLNSFGVTDIKGAACGWNGVLMSTGAPVTLVDGRVWYFMLDEITKTTTVTSIQFYEVATASFTADNTNNIALCRYDGTNFVKIAETANDGTMYNTGNSAKTVNLTSPIVITPGTYAVAFVYNSSAQTTAPTIAAVATSFQSFMYPSNFKIASYTTGASIPSSVAVSSCTGTTSMGWFILK